MNQYAMIETALNEHKKLSLISGARLVNLSVDIYEGGEYYDRELCIAVRVETISWNCGTKKELSYTYLRKDGSLIGSVRAC